MCHAWETDLVKLQKVCEANFGPGILSFSSFVFRSTCAFCPLTELPNPHPSQTFTLFNHNLQGKIGECHCTYMVERQTLWTLTTVVSFMCQLCEILRYLVKLYSCVSVKADNYTYCLVWLGDCGLIQSLQHRNRTERLSRRKCFCFACLNWDMGVFQPSAWEGLTDMLALLWSQSCWLSLLWAPLVLRTPESDRSSALDSS